tara:strand:- start:51 stop:431 length:381 start_codon:yes stop_codon:yes gene_type:complete
MTTDNRIELNVLGEPLESCCESPMTGYFRDGFCRTDGTDFGQHLTCVVMTNEFLSFSKARGNDLSTPRLEYGFPGLKAGDRWCLCAERWTEALEAGIAPNLHLKSTHFDMLSLVQIEVLEKYAVED